MKHKPLQTAPTDADELRCTKAKIDVLLARHPWPWKLEAPIALGPRCVVDKDHWTVFEIVSGNRSCEVDVLEAIFSLVEAHVEAAAKLRVEMPLSPAEGGEAEGRTEAKEEKP